ncbi:MAG: pantoate--beta-alanine ligase [Dehalococcoidia bacterium]|nr:pantoate--beta-alanine ligase [Dehalococcoidia bacterium]
MRVVDTVAVMKKVRRDASGTVGFVPTMGYLHEGHLSLARRARPENDLVVASIFVNPTQFGPNEDFSRYPRDPERDLAMLSSEAVDLVFMPSVEELYPDGFNTSVEVGGITGRLEGAIRPGHFKGVATIVNKLFNIVQPTRAYFGQKDAQQAIVIGKMVTDLDLNVEVVVMPTVREQDGLAMSSRNVYLNGEERRAALVLHRSLKLASEMRQAGEQSAGKLRLAMTALIESEPLARIDYVSVADVRTLEELDTIAGPTLLSLAVRIGKTRLIDNTILE